MDLVSRLLALMPVTAAFDTHCQFGAAWRIDGRATTKREIAWHVLLSGAAILEDNDGPPVRMEAGDVALFPAGGAHVLHDGSGKSAGAPIFIQDAGFGLARNGRGAAVELLCGRFLLPSAPRQLLREYLPARLLIHSRPEMPVQPAQLADPSDRNSHGDRRALPHADRARNRNDRQGSGLLVQGGIPAGIQALFRNHARTVAAGPRRRASFYPANGNQTRRSRQRGYGDRYPYLAAVEQIGMSAGKFAYRHRAATGELLDVVVRSTHATVAIVE